MSKTDHVPDGASRYAVRTARSASLMAISGYSTGEDRKRSKAAGFDEHLAKPADFNQRNE